MTKKKQQKKGYEYQPSSKQKDYKKEIEFNL